MNFVEIAVSCSLDFRDILVAEMADLDYDTFEETDVGFKGYISEPLFDDELIRGLFDRYNTAVISFRQSFVKRENWNETWEKNYSPIFVGDQIVVRASFHEIKEEFPYEILITPKMSFGTGHHETTQLMLANQLKIDHRNKKVYDVGCGTGILGIFACKLGAKEVSACDIDEWCVENSKENVLINQVDIKVNSGALDQLETSSDYNIVLVNINKNILLKDAKSYVDLLAWDGVLVISGFYIEDVYEIGKEFALHGLEVMEQTNQNRWASIIFNRTSTNSQEL